MTDHADRLQAVAKARIIIKSLGWRKPSSVGIEDADDKEFKCAVIEFIESPDNLPLNVVFKQTPIILSIDADAAWREKQDGGECPECKNYIGHCPACHRDLPTKLPSECPYCGGSGHREDAEEYIRRMGPPAQEMPATHPPIAPEGDVERVAITIWNARSFTDESGTWEQAGSIEGGHAQEECRRIARAVLAISPAPQQARSEDEELGRLLAEADAVVFGMSDMLDSDGWDAFHKEAAIRRHRARQSALAAKR